MHLDWLSFLEALAHVARFKALPRASDLDADERFPGDKAADLARWAQSRAAAPYDTPYRARCACTAGSTRLRILLCLDTPARHPKPRELCPRSYTHAVIVHVTRLPSNLFHPPTHKLTHPPTPPFKVPRRQGPQLGQLPRRQPAAALSRRRGLRRRAAGPPLGGSSRSSSGRIRLRGDGGWSGGGGGGWRRRRRRRRRRQRRAVPPASRAAAQPGGVPRRETRQGQGQAGPQAVGTDSGCQRRTYLS